MNLDVFRKEIEFPAIEITQPIGTFYIGGIQWKDLIEIAAADIRRLEDDALDNYIGIQRRLSPSRVNAIGRYVNHVDASFPTSVILAVPEGSAFWDEKKNILTLKGTEDKPLNELATIIDGQHRVEGLKSFQGEDFQINVSVFVGAPIAMQANIFATVNLAQTKVNKSLVYDLYDYEKYRSPQKSAHHIAVALDQFEKSPLFKRIKRLGTATPGRRNEQLNQATVVESLMPYLSSDPTQDRNISLLRRTLKPYSEEELHQVIFGNLWRARKDEEITEILFNYFTAVKNRWPNSWNDFTTPGNILPKANGFTSLMSVLRPIYKLALSNTGRVVPTTNDFARIFNKVTTLEDDQINTEIFKPGSSGSALMKRMLLLDIFEVEQERDIEFDADLFT